MRSRMKRLLFVIVTFFQSAFLMAEDYSGRHVTDDGGGFDLPTSIALVLLLIVSIIAIIFSGGKLKDEKDGSLFGCLGYIGIIAFVFFCYKACS